MDINALLETGPKIVLGYEQAKGCALDSVGSIGSLSSSSISSSSSSRALEREPAGIVGWIIGVLGNGSSGGIGEDGGPCDIFFASTSSVNISVKRDIYGRVAFFCGSIVHVAEARELAIGFMMGLINLHFLLRQNEEFLQVFNETS